MQTLKIPITIPKEYVFDSFDQKSSEVIVKAQPKDVVERIRTLADVMRELGDNDQDVIDYKKLLTLFDIDHHIVNYQLCVLIIKALNEKRQPNWDDSSYKYTLYFFMGSSGFRYHVYDVWNAYSTVGSRLCFLEKRIGLHAVDQPEFLNAFKNFMTIKK